MQKFNVGWNILHRSAVMRKADIALKIHNTIQRHASQLKKIHFLLVHSGNFMIGIWQADKGNIFIAPILLECRRRIRSDRNDLGTVTFELFIFITQARQLRAAIWSHEAAQEREHNRFVITKV